MYKFDDNIRQLRGANRHGPTLGDFRYIFVPHEFLNRQRPRYHISTRDVPPSVRASLANVYLTSNDAMTVEEGFECSLRWLELDNEIRIRIQRYDWRHE